MPNSDEASKMRIDLDAEGFKISEADVTSIETDVDYLRPLVKDFPTAVLYITIVLNESSQQYEVRTSLVLPGRTFSTGDTAEHWQPSLEQCLRKVGRRVEHYKSSMSGDARHAHLAAGTVHDVEPSQLIDGQKVQEAHEQDDYVSFRRCLFPYEDSLRTRIGRWIERYPQVTAALGHRLQIDDIIEETFLLAFERYPKWPREVLFGDWLEHLIDPAVRLLARHPTRELETISYMRTLQETTP
ncbi:hypothetical protein [Candidatus Laterigemmans baculatus]|uniref:hypothetical protein n=1 Tax=Candidatus Laterigemmans baculatus TaxID=2770505 RepID=UPI0013DADF44|nr:hypothetical protein [Candidatus Laterigemmans baculatus]